MSDAWQQFLHAVDSTRRDLGCRDGYECFFRGHSTKEHLLLPTLLRHCAERGITKPRDIRDLEAGLFFEFRSRARELHMSHPDSWEVLFNMRHHGLATRLLDWTSVLGVAVYFALKQAAAGGTPCVWILNPYALNRISWNIDDLVAPEYLTRVYPLDKAIANEDRTHKELFEELCQYDDYDFCDYLVAENEESVFHWDEPVALYPIQKNARLHAQQGYFTIHGNDIRPLDQIDGLSGLVARVDLPEDAWTDARRFLGDAGINEYLLFPDLDGLTRYLHETYEISGSSKAR